MCGNLDKTQYIEQCTWREELGSRNENREQADLLPWIITKQKSIILSINKDDLPPWLFRILQKVLQVKFLSKPLSEFCIIWEISDIQWSPWHTSLMDLNKRSTFHINLYKLEGFIFLQKPNQNAYSGPSFPENYSIFVKKKFQSLQSHNTTSRLRCRSLKYYDWREHLILWYPVYVMDNCKADTIYLDISALTCCSLHTRPSWTLMKQHIFIQAVIGYQSIVYGIWCSWWAKP